jgi:hypothetical protein
MSLHGQVKPVDASYDGNRSVDSLPCEQHNNALFQCELVELVSNNERELVRMSGSS